MKENGGYRSYFSRTGAVVTIHNAGQGYHQEVNDLDFAHAITGLPRRVIDDSLLNGSFDPFLAASGYSVLNTVSGNYAVELQQSQEDGRASTVLRAMSSSTAVVPSSSSRWRLA